MSDLIRGVQASSALLRPPVYWIEADEEASVFIPGERQNAGRRSLLAYLLLGRRVVAHPADLWQSPHSNCLLFHEQAQPILKGVVQLHLGDSTTVSEYISDRVEKLKRDEASSQGSAVELSQYLRYGDLLKEQSDILDDNFTKLGATFRVEGSRDVRFRKLIRRDLEDGPPFGEHLAASIRQALDRKNADKMLKLLTELTHDRRRFISIDGILSRLKECRSSNSFLTKIHNRLQMLHWEARSEGAIQMPLLARAKGGGLEASDPDVFWVAIDGLLGKEFQTSLMSLQWPVAVAIVADLRKDGMWIKFIDTYHAIVETVEQDYQKISEEMVRSRAQIKYPSLLTIGIANLPDKWTTLSWVCTAGSWCVGGMEVWAFMFRAGSLAATVKRSYDWAVRWVSALHSSERHLLNSRIRNLIADATRTK